MAKPQPRLPDAEQKALSMASTSLMMQDIDPNTDENYSILKDAYTKKQMQEPEQARLRSQFRRFDHFYYPNTLTLGGADHWAEDPSARTAGRAHVSVNVHPAYVNIPASLQAVPPVVNYVPTTMDKAGRAQAARRERLYFAWAEANELDVRLEEACLYKSLYGHTAAKITWDAIAGVPRVSIIDTPENLYLGYGDSNYNRIDWAIYAYGLSPQAAMEDFGIEIIPVQDGKNWHPYTFQASHSDPLANVYSKEYSRDPGRINTAYDNMKITVLDYWYKHPTKPGKPPLVCNALIVGNTIVKISKHPELAGVLPYVTLRNSMIPGSPYGKSELFDVEQLLREKDERITAQAQMIQSVVGGQMWQLVGGDAPDEVPANAIPKPGRVATPGPGNELRAITPFIPQFQVEDYNKRIDREIAVVTGLNDLLLGLAPSSVLGSSRAIASLVANYEQRIAPKRKLLYSWIKKVWEMSARMWEAKDKAISEIIGGEYRLEIVPPELTPRDTLELAQTALNLVQGRIWSAERAMDRVGVEDPEGEKDVIRDEQTDATLNPAAVLTMGQLMMMFQQLQAQQAQMQAQQAQMQAQMGQAQQGQPQPGGELGGPGVPPGIQQQLEAQQASAQNAFRQVGQPAGTEMMNGGEMGNVPPEMLPENAQPGAAPQEGVGQPGDLGAQIAALRQQKTINRLAR